MIEEEKDEEYQGLTGSMVRSYLDLHGWRKTAEQLSGATYHWSDEHQIGIWAFDDKISQIVAMQSIAWSEKRSIKSILRDINPRMRVGMPSNQALLAHSTWLVLDIETGEIELHISWDGRLWSCSSWNTKEAKPNIDAYPLPDCPQFRFWPCDKNGNKTCWITDDAGKML